MKSSMEYDKLRMSMRMGNARYSADPDDASAQIDLIGVPWLMISEEPSVGAERRTLVCGRGPAQVTGRDLISDSACDRLADSARMHRESSAGLSARPIDQVLFSALFGSAAWCIAGGSSTGIRY
jgi:hypothetical protein